LLDSSSTERIITADFGKDFAALAAAFPFPLISKISTTI